MIIEMCKKIEKFKKTCYNKIIRRDCVKTLIISDLDGTLLTGRERISDYSLKELNELIAQGLSFTYATARSYNSASRACEGLKQRLPVILYNGALILDPEGKRRLYSGCFNRGQVAFIREQLVRGGIPPLVYSFCEGRECVSWQEGKETAGILRYLSRRRGDPRLRPVKDFEKLFEGEIFYVSCIDEKSRLDDLNEAVEKSLDLRSIYEQEVYQTDYWCEIMPQTTSKGAAARFLADYLGMERIVAFGDAPNDISLFAAADEGYAVKNADESLKAVATGVIGYSEEDAVVKHIRAHIDEYIR